MNGWQKVSSRKDGSESLGYRVDENKLFPPGVDVTWNQDNNTYYINCLSGRVEVIPPMWIVKTEAGIELKSEPEFAKDYVIAPIEDMVINRRL